MDDWRLNGQEDYLFGKRLSKKILNQLDGMIMSIAISAGARSVIAARALLNLDIALKMRSTGYAKHVIKTLKTRSSGSLSELYG